MSDAGILDRIIEREGTAFTNDPSDRGGATKYGITQRAYDAYRLEHDALATWAPFVKDLNEPHARQFYTDVYLTPFAFVTNDQLRELVVDCAINHGAARATKWLQAAAGLTADGVVGPVTRSYFSAPVLFGEYANHMTAYRELLKTRFRFYAEIATDQNGPSVDPDAKFLRGWINRACWFIK